MNVLIITLLLTIIVCLVLMWIATTYNRYQDYIIRINEAEANIDTTLRKRFDLLNKSIGIIKDNIDSDDEVLEEVIKLRSKKLDNFELDRYLYSAINDFQSYFMKYKELRKIDELTKIGLGLTESEIEMVASRKYYNDVITDFNKMGATFPSNLVGSIGKFKTKPYFGNDDDTVKL